MKGSGLLLLWNDIDPAVDAEYNRWHSTEHVPERVTVPGILSGRRYVRVGEGAQRYLTIYELESTAVLSSPAYLSLAESPTPWSRRMRINFSNVTRIACHRLLSAGAGMGASLMMIRMDGDARDESAIANTMAACRATEGIVAVHWCRTDPGVPGLSWQATTAPSARHERILIAEATDVASLAAARTQLEQLARHGAGSTETLTGPGYALLHVVQA
jgi:hypothetical protein